MKLMLLAAVALAGLMEEATDGTTGSAGGTAPDIADTSGDKPGEPAGAHLDSAAKAEEPAAAVEVVVEPTSDEYADACAAGKPRIALVGKYSDRVPVQLKSQGHLDTLRGEHGEGAVEVQP